jgi:plasmid stability protein
MRTTLHLPDEVYRDLKIRAAQEGVTVTSAVEQALRDYLATSTSRRSEVTLPVLPETGGPRPGVDLADPGSVYDLLYGEDDR